MAARAARRAGPDYKGWGQRVRAERTRNIWFIFVTLEVTQLDMSALKFCKLSKSSYMSVMSETPQSATGPYVARADAASSL